MATAEAPEVMGELRAFFAEVVQWFWAWKVEEPLGHCFPKVLFGGIQDAILRAHGLSYGDLPKKLGQLQQVFPELENGHVWQVGTIITWNDSSRERRLANRFTTPRAVNEFLISDLVLDRLTGAFPEAMLAMKTEEARRTAHYASR